jgi:hypothetical protein
MSNIELVDLATVVGGTKNITAAGTAILSLLGHQPLPQIQRPQPEPTSTSRTMDPIKPLLPIKLP